MNDDQLETINRLLENLADARETIAALESPHGFIRHLNEQATECYRVAHDHGFWPQNNERNKGEQIALIHSELSEMLEACRKPGMDRHCPQFTHEEVECADVLIRLLDYAHGHGMRLALAFLAKVEVNKNRPHRHGKNF